MNPKIRIIVVVYSLALIIVGVLICQIFELTKKNAKNTVCRNFNSQTEAKVFVFLHGPLATHLDREKDGLPCESLKK